LVYRLLDDRYKADGAPAKTVRLVTYRTRLGPGAIVPSVTVRYARTFDGAEFYRDGSRGFVAATVGDADALRRFLSATDDLLGATIRDGRLTLNGRKYPESTYKRPYRRVDLGDIRILHQAMQSLTFSDQQSEIGFSLDPWFEKKPIAKEI